MYRLAPSRCARRPKQPANRTRNVPSRSSTARAVDSDKSMAHQHTKLLQKSTVRIIGSLVRKNGSDKVLLGALLTGDMIARGRVMFERIGVCNQSPTFPPLFLTFLEYPQWIRPTDAALVR